MRLASLSIFCFVAFSTIVEPIRAQPCSQLVMDHVTAINKSTLDLTADPQNSTKQKAKDDAVADLNDDLGFDRGTTCLVGLILKTKSEALTQANIAQIESQIKAAFQQNGSSTGTGGSTNLVSKGITAQLLSLAAEYGALTESTSGSTVTLQGGLGGISTALEEKAILPPCGSPVTMDSACIRNGLINALNRVSYSVGFNTSQGSQSVTGTPTSSSSASAQPANFTANGKTLSSVTAKGVIIQGPVANAPAVSAAITKLAATGPSVVADKTLQAARIKLTKACQKALTQNLAGRPITWTRDASNILSGADASDPTAFSKAWYGLGSELITALEQDPTCKAEYASDSLSVASSLNAYLASLNTFFEGLRGTPVLSLEYDYNTPASQPSNSTIRLIGQLSKNSWTGTLNAAGSFYNSAPSSAIPSATLVRDFQVAAEATYNFGSGKTPNPIFGNSTASLAYYYQDQTSPAILNVTPGQPVTGITFTGLPSTATQVYATRGVINIGQAKFTLNPGNLGINIPISFTWSNRTELVTSPSWRGQIGISYDLDSLFSKSP
jgi:hypothetical protein